jgi:hypothetical protein
MHKDKKTGALIRKWTTTSIVDDPEEQEAARATVSAVWSTISKICRSTDFGLMAPEESLAELQEAIPVAYAIADKFNQGAKLNRVKVSIMVGRVAQDDVLAAEAMRKEVTSLIDTAMKGVAELNPKTVRDAMAQLKTTADMLSDEAKAKAEGIIDTARASANETAKAIRKLEKAGEAVAVDIDTVTLEALEAARVDFLDLTTDGEISALDVVDDRVLDLD